MSKINVTIEIPDGFETFLKFLPLNIRNKYMSSIMNAVTKQNEKMIIDGITSVIQDLLQVALSSKDEQILQEELNKALEKHGIIMDEKKKTIKVKKSEPSGFKKEEVPEMPIEQTILTKEVSDLVDNIQSNDNTNIKKLDNDEEEQELPLPNKEIDINVKSLDLEKMFTDQGQSK